MTGPELSPYYLISFKLADYKARHGGKRPARIFMSHIMFMEVTRDIKCNYQAGYYGEHKLFGIRVSTFQSDDPLVYLSDEEAEPND